MQKRVGGWGGTRGAWTCSLGLSQCLLLTKMVHGAQHEIVGLVFTFKDISRPSMCDVSAIGYHSYSMLSNIQDFKKY